MRPAAIWSAIDALADRNGLSPSGLARRAGLDATSFNKSKRRAPDGSPRWLSTESLMKTLDAVGATMDEFIALAENRPGPFAPLLGFAKAGNDGYFDADGFPAGDGWEEIRFPGLEGQNVYALQITGDSMEPVYRAGDRIVIDPEAELRRGDRVVARTTDGEVLAKQLGRRTARSVELLSLNPDYAPRQIPRQQIAWMARILWASQ